MGLGQTVIISSIFLDFFLSFSFCDREPEGIFFYFFWYYHLTACASFMHFLHNAAFIILAMFILHGCNITDNASDGWIVDGHVHLRLSCETKVLFVYVLSDFDITNTKKCCQNVDDNFLIEL